MKPDFPISPRRFPIFYGWVIMVATIAGTLMSIPGQTIGVGVFTDFLIESTGLDRLTLSSAYMFGTIGSSLILPFSGRLLDSRGSRYLIIVTSLGLAIAMVMLGNIEGILYRTSSTLSFIRPSILAFFLMLFNFLLMRQFGQGLMDLSSRTMLSKWFDRKRGTVTGISGVFISFGFSAAPLFLNWMINQSSWQNTCFQLAVLSGVGMTLFGWVFFRDNPEECGLKMDGATPNKSTDKDSFSAQLPEEAEIEIPLNVARRSYTFWIFNLGLSLYALIITGLVFHIASFGAASGLSRSEVFAMFLPISVVSVITNLVGGWLSDRIQLKYLLMIMLAGLSSGTFAMLQIDSLVGKIAMTVGLGIPGGLILSLTGVTWARYFGRKHLGAIAGLNMASMVFASSIGPTIFGVSQKLYDQYDPAVWVCGALPLVILLASFGIRRHQ